jgi:tetratricopeptide (TPR) repeat protein
MAWSLRRQDPMPPVNDPAPKPPLDYQETLILPPESRTPAKQVARGRWIWPPLLVLGVVAVAGILYAVWGPGADQPVVVRVPIQTEHTTGPAAPSGPMPPPAREAEAPKVDPQVAEWLQEARQNLEAWNLTAPQDRNAYHFYRKVLERDPDNAAAREGLEAIAERYGQLAERELRRDNYQKALDFVATGLSVDADHRRLWDLKARINEQAEQGRQRQIQRLLVQANDALNAYKLTKPREDSALHYYREVEKLDPGNSEARRGREKIADRYGVLADKEMNRFDYDNARRYIATGLDVDPDNPRLLALQIEVNKRLDQRVLRSIKNLFD